MMQLEMRFENNNHSQMILEANFDHLSNQCEILLKAFKRGERLTVRDGMIKYGIGDLRRRVKDLRDAEFEIKDELKQGRFKEYYL